MAATGYRFAVKIDWLPALDEAGLTAMFEVRRREQGARHVSRAPAEGLPARLWERLVALAGIPTGRTWAALTRAERQQLTRQLRATELAVSGKSLNRDEFVTCGGVRLSEIDFKTMGSRCCPGLHFAGELLDIDGITGGFNFQAAWTTGWLAGRAMAGALE
jgi:predicted Rossmann fold flavoprotein